MLMLTLNGVDGNTVVCVVTSIQLCMSLTLALVLLSIQFNLHSCIMSLFEIDNQCYS
jgi:hypothetical protein